MKEYIARDDVYEAIVSSSVYRFVTETLKGGKIIDHREKEYLLYDEIVPKIIRIPNSIEIGENTRIMDWTPCSEKYPKLGKLVIVTIYGDDLDVGWFGVDENKEIYFYTSDYKLSQRETREQISAWMYLPSAYKEVK